MEIPVLVEPSPAGFRAVTGGPLDLSAEGPTADAALAARRSLIADRLRSGAQLRTLTVTDVAGILEAARRLRENPMFEEFEKAIDEYRREHNTIPTPDDPT
jgi:hypothetical protein